MTLRYFRPAEFSCTCCNENRMDEQFLVELDELRHRYGKPLIVSSGYRCPKHNRRVSSTGDDGPHVLGLAVDLRVDRENAVKLLEIAMAMSFTGFGVNQKGSARFIHVDRVPRQTRTIWSY